MAYIPFDPDPSSDYTRKAVAGDTGDSITNIDQSLTSMDESLTSIDESMSSVDNSLTTIKQTLETSAKGAVNMVVGQVAVAVTATAIAASRATRRSITVKNIDTLITLFVGPTATVTLLNGFQLLPGEGVTWDVTGAVGGISVSGSPRVSYIEWYD